MKRETKWKRVGRVWRRWAYRSRPGGDMFEWHRQTFDPRAEYALGYALIVETVLESELLKYCDERVRMSMSGCMPPRFLKKIVFGVEMEKDRITGRWIPIVMGTFKPQVKA